VPGKRKRARDPSYAVPKPTADEILAFGSRFRQASTDFLKVDLATALTFTEIALQASDSEKRERNCRNARVAYDTVLRLIERVDLTDEDSEMLNSNLARLKSELARLGEVF